MGQTVTRDTIRTRIRDYMYEASADWFTDAQLNRLISEEVLSLPTRGISNEAVYTTNLVIDQTEYSLPTNYIEVQNIEINVGSLASASWQEFKGWRDFNGSIYLDGKPKAADEIRIFIDTTFTVPTGDSVALDMDDDVTEILVWGVVVRCYRMVIGYMRQSKNWDSVSKPDFMTLGTVTEWYREAKRDYLDLIAQYSSSPGTRDINLVS